MHGRAHEVFLHQWSWNVAEWPILCRCDVKPKTNKTRWFNSDSTVTITYFMFVSVLHLYPIRESSKLLWYLFSMCSEIHDYYFWMYCFCLKGTTGWGRAHKRAIQSWYTKFEQNPEILTRLIRKYGKGYKWKHKDVIRLCHAKTDDNVMKFIFRYKRHKTFKLNSASLK
jgi:hypothetical protein